MNDRIVVTGNPIDGFAYHGPFDTFEDAEEWAQNAGVMGDWWITDLLPPVAKTLPLHYPGAAIPIPAEPYTHVRKVGGEHVTVTGHVNGITIFNSDDERGEELLDVVFDELFEPIETESTWEPTHYSRKDGSGAVMLTANRLTGIITFVNENGDQWDDPESEWEPA
jgi:hypothetical protein